MRWIAVGLTFLVLLEVTARVVVFGPRGLDPRRVGLLRDLHPEALVHFDTDPLLVYEYRPHIDVFFKLVPFRTNSHGMRDREYPFAKPAGCRRVAVIGSSFALPAGVPIEQAFHSRLETELPGCTEFLNFAVGMHGPSQFLAMLRERALRFDPDLVVVSVTALSVPGMLGPWDRVPPPNVLHIVPRGPRSILDQLVRSRLGLRTRLIQESESTRTADAPREQQVVTKLGELARARALPIVLMRLEVDAIAPTPRERRLERRARAEGLRYFDTRWAFRGQDHRSYRIFELDPHWNGDAHAIFARELGAFLKAEGLLEEDAAFSGSRTRRERSAASP